MSSDSQFTPQGIVRRITSSLGGIQRQNSINAADDARGPLGLRVQHEPKDPFVEFLFVHGFPGGSRKTWSFSEEPATFWPREWLPHEPGFSHVRIHTFGFDADWSDRRGDITRINYVGKLLLDSLASNPYFRKNEINPIVFISHSLGGLVVKKTVNEAKQNPVYENLARRFHSFFFLGTPHHGLDSSMVKNILRSGMPEGRGHYINEIEPSFTIVADEINQNFRHNCQTSQLYSFYETQSSFPGSQTLIVPRNNANLGFADHDPIPLTGDHHGITRFADTASPAYQLLRDHLKAVVEDISEDFLNPEKAMSQMRLIAKYLDIADTEEEEVASLDTVANSCDWLLDKQSFLKWRDTIVRDPRREPDLVHRISRLSIKTPLRAQTRDLPRVYWLLGPAGCGKSCLAAYIVRHLESQDRPCSYYFLKHTDRSKQTIASLLRALAFQMAGFDVALRRALLSMQQEDSLTADVHDVRVLWKQLFIQTIFKIGFSTPHYWIIDALDEGLGGSELLRLFEKIPANLPLKILITSRHDPQWERDIRGLPITIENIEIEDTLRDIKLFLEQNRDCIHDTPARVEILIKELVNRSGGSFLWARLVLERLDTVWNQRAISMAIREIPSDMNQLYLRVVEEMALKPNKHLAKAILRWTICAGRSLTLLELQEAIERDIDDSVPMIERMIGDVCGQLVTIEKQGRVRLVHDTARDFLLQEDLQSEFAVEKAAAHGRVADVCLRYLIEGEGKHLSRSKSSRSSTISASALREYAHLFFAEHIMKGPPPESDVVMDRVLEYLESRVLHTVEYIAASQDIQCLIQIGKNLGAWIDRRSDQSLLTKEMKFVQSWSTDLIRLVTVFGKHILREPKSVHTVIPSLCPQLSQVYKRFGRHSLGMEVKGISPKGWTDRIFSASFQDDHTSAFAYSETRYAVGLRNGTIVLYDVSTCQEVARLLNKTAVKKMEFSLLNDWILVAETRRLSLWNYNSHEVIWTANTSSDVMAMGFFEEDSLIDIATRSNCIITYDVSDGAILNEDSWHGVESSNRNNKPPMRVFMSPELGLVAIVYRFQELWLLDLTNLAVPRYFGGQSTVTALAFNPALKMMVVGFLDGEVCTVSLSSLQKEAHIFANAEHLVVSGDGKTLLIGDKMGSIRIYDFESLTEIYNIKFEDEDIMWLTFSTNSLQILDVRRREFNIWEPSALYRRKDTDDSASAGPTSYGTALTEQYQNQSSSDSAIVNAVTCHHTGNYLFRGDANGCVSVHNAVDGRFSQTLFSHGHMGVVFLEWNVAQEILVTSDTSNLVMAHKVQLVQKLSGRISKPAWQATFLFECRMDSNVRQLLISIDGEYLMVATPARDHLLNFRGEAELYHQCDSPESSRTLSQKWTVHPRHKRHLYKIEVNGVYHVSWARDTTTKPDIQFVETKPDEKVGFETHTTGIHFVKLNENPSSPALWATYDNYELTRPLLWEHTASPHVEDTTTPPPAPPHQIGPEVQRVIGIFRSLLIFLNQEGCLCSLSIDRMPSNKLYTRHFPVPHCWQSLGQRLIATVTPRGDIVIVKGSELAVVKRGLGLHTATSPVT